MAQPYHPGMEVEYYSTSLNQWIPARVLRGGHPHGTVDLDCKEGVEVARVRPPRGAAAGTGPGRGSPTGASGTSRGGAAAGGPLGLREGEPCFYRSATLGWITAQVVRFKPDDMTYDLDVKQQVSPEGIYPLQEGAHVEYHSTSSDRWIPAKIVRRGTAPSTFDLDCKDGVNISRLRPPPDAGGQGQGSRQAVAARGYGVAAKLAALPEQGVYHDAVATAQAEAIRMRKLGELRQAIRSDDPDSLKRRLESTSALALVGEEDLDLAGHKLWALEARPQAQAELRRAAAGRNRTVLEAALEAAVAAGVPAAEVEAGRQALRKLETSPLWRYDSGDGHHVDLRQQPQIDGPRVRQRLNCGDIFCASEERRGTDGVVYLQLSDGRGWAFDRKPGVGVMCTRYVVQDDDRPGPYVVIHDKTGVTPTQNISSEDIVGQLPYGTVVNVLEVVTLAACRRVRGRLESPAGWVSLLDTDTGRRWAVKQTGDARRRSGVNDR